MNRLFTVVFCIILGIAPALGQSMYHTGFSAEGVVIPDTVNMNDEYLIDFVLENKGTESITNTINVYLATYDETNGLNPQHWIGGFSNINLAPGETFTPPNPEEVYDNVFPSNYYGPGDNIVVIWPMIDFDEPQNQDSEHFYNDLYVNDPNDIIEIEPLRFESVVTEGLISIQSQAAIATIVMFNLQGKIAYKGSDKEITTTGFAEGMYVVQLNFKDGLSQSRKVLVK